jgi:hypothetical protein
MKSTNNKFPLQIRIKIKKRLNGFCFSELRFDIYFDFSDFGIIISDLLPGFGISHYF